jgi:hypothetical protein
MKKNEKDLDRYAMTVSGNQARLALEDVSDGVVIPPLLFERAQTNAKVATDWEPNRVYTVHDSDAPSTKMKAIFEEDQRVRLNDQMDWNEVSQSDAQRRERTRQLLTEGALHTGKDYEEAAFVFQHGNQPRDYLLAHTLAMIAVSKGDATAIWLTTATLDRYLKSIGQKQVFGTQYSQTDHEQWTQEPYDRDLISDRLREQLGVPSQAAQAEQLKAYQQQK